MNSLVYRMLLYILSVKACEKIDANRRDGGVQPEFNNRRA